MAKSIVLYGVLFGAVVCLCGYFDSVDIDSYRQSAVSYQPPSVILSGTQWSRKISLLEAQTVGLPAEENLIRTQIKQIYCAEVGVREKTGKNDGERVEEYLAVTQLGKGYAWCASFISWVFAEAGFSQPRTPWSPALFPKERVVWERGRQLSATGFQLPAISPPLSVISTAAQQNGEISAFSTLSVKGSGTKALYGRLNLSSTRALKPNTQHLIPKASYLKPATADIFGIYFANLKRIAHVGFVDEWGDKYLITVEGNTNEAAVTKAMGCIKSGV